MGASEIHHSGIDLLQTRSGWYEWSKAIILSFVMAVLGFRDGVASGSPPAIRGGFHMNSETVWPVDKALISSATYEMRDYLAMKAPYAYLASGDLGLAIFELRNPLTPRFLGRVGLPGGAASVVVHENLAIVRGSSNLVHVLDVGLPELPILRSSTRVGSEVYSTRMEGDRLYVLGDGGIQIFDLSVPSRPALLGQSSFLPSARNFSVQDRKLFFTLAERIRILDVQQPEQIRTLSAIGDAAGIPPLMRSAVHSEVLFAPGFSFLYVFDIASASEPRLITKVPMDSSGVPSIADLWIQSNWLFVHSSGAGFGPGFLSIFDITNPRLPSLLTKLPAIGLLPIHLCGELLVVGDLDADGFEVYDFHNPSSPVHLASTPDLPPDSDTYLQKITDDQAFLFTPRGMLSFGVTNFSPPTFLSEFPLPVSDSGEGRDGIRVEIVSNRVYQSSSSGELSILDAGLPIFPKLLSSSRFGDGLRILGERKGVLSLAISNILTGQSTLVLVDARQPEQLVTQSSLPLPLSILNAVQTDAYLYAISKSKFAVINISDPKNPRLVREEHYPTEAYRILGMGSGWLYVQEFVPEGSVRFYTLTDPETPILVQIIDNNGLQADPFVFDRCVYLRIADSAYALDGTNLLHYTFDQNRPNISAGTLSLTNHVPGVGWRGARPPFEIVRHELVFQSTGIAQQLAFDPLPDIVLGSPPFRLSATTSSGLPVTFQVVEGPAVVRDGFLTSTNTGRVVVRAEQAGDAEWLPVSAERSFMVLRRYFSLFLAATNGLVRLVPDRSTFAEGEIVQLRAEPSPGFLFTGWSGDIQSAQNPLSLAVTNNLSVVANFATTSLSILTEGDGQVLRYPQKPDYQLDEWVELTALPDRWYRFAAWKDQVSSNPRRIRIGPASTYTAVFEPVTDLEIVLLDGMARKAPVGMPVVRLDGRFVTNSTLVVSGGTRISLSTSFPNGTLLYTLDGTPPNFFSARYLAPFPLRRSATLRVMATSEDFSIVWEADPLELNILPGHRLTTETRGGGTISTTPALEYVPPGTTLIARALPNPGWSFEQWLGDASGEEPVIQIQMDLDRRIEASFATRVGIEIQGRGVVLAEPSSRVAAYGDTIQLGAIPDPGWGFVGWSGAKTDTAHSIEVLVTDPNPTFKASFAPLSGGSYSLAVLSVGHGSVRSSSRGRVFPSGTHISLVAIPDPDEAFLGWTGTFTNAENTLSFEISSDMVVTATFSARPRLLISLAGASTELSTPLGQLQGRVGGRYLVQATRGFEHEWRSLVRLTNRFSRSQFVVPMQDAVSREFMRVVEAEQ